MAQCMGVMYAVWELGIHEEMHVVFWKRNGKRAETKLRVPCDTKDEEQEL